MPLLEHCNLVIDFNHNNLKVAHEKWLKHNILLCVVNSIPESAKELSERSFLFAAVLSITEPALPQLQLLRQIRPISILLYPDDYNIPTRSRDFFIGIDSFFDSGPDANLLIEKSKDFFCYLDRHDAIPPVTIHTHKDKFLVVEYRKCLYADRKSSLHGPISICWSCLCPRPGGCSPMSKFIIMFMAMMTFRLKA